MNRSRADEKIGRAEDSKEEEMRTKAMSLAAICVGGSFAMPVPVQAWEPTKPIEIIVPAGTGGGADQMARVMQGIITKHNLSKQSVVVINKSGGAGGEGFLDVKNSKGDDHKLIITLSNLFTTPLATGIPFSWKDLTPVAMMALDEFVLWVNADKPYKSVKDYVTAIKAAPDNQFKMGGTGSKQEDQIITVALEKATGKKMTYIPYKGGGAVAVQLVGGHVDSTVNNPIEARSEEHTSELQSLRHLVCRLLLVSSSTAIHTHSLHDALPIWRPITSSRWAAPAPSRKTRSSRSRSKRRPARR